MIHFYTTKHHDRDFPNEQSVTLLCSGTRVPYRGPNDRWSSETYAVSCTVPHKVTCPECLERLLPEWRSRLLRMEKNLQVARTAHPAPQNIKTIEEAKP